MHNGREFEELCMVARLDPGYKKLILYERMMELSLLIYELTEHFPQSERYGLVSQLRRATVSVISNFSEGYLKRSKKEKLLFLERSESSLHEIDAQADLSFRLGYLNQELYNTLLDKVSEVSYLLKRYVKKIEA